MWVAFLMVPNPPTCRSFSRPSSSWLSTRRRPRRLVWTYQTSCSRLPTTSSIEQLAALLVRVKGRLASGLLHLQSVSAVPQLSAMPRIDSHNAASCHSTHAAQQTRPTLLRRRFLARRIPRSTRLALHRSARGGHAARFVTGAGWYFFSTTRYCNVVAPMLENSCQGIGGTSAKAPGTTSTLRLPLSSCTSACPPLST